MAKEISERIEALKNKLPPVKLTPHPNPTEVCEAVHLLMKRMESNIREFFIDGQKTRFGDITHTVRLRILDPEKNKDRLFILNDTEIQAYWNKYIEESKKELHREVMARILSAGEREEYDEEEVI
jgi:hypothetical protein